VEIEQHGIRNSMNVVAVVPARSGSKGFPGKNIATIKGRSLLELAVQAGVDSGCVDNVYVSTDSPEYEKIAVAAGAKSTGLRAADLADDKARTVDVLVDLLGRLPSNDIVVLLQPTSPVRSLEDVDACVSLLLDSPDADAVVSVAPLDEPHPHKLTVIDGKGRLQLFLPGSAPDTPRQLLPPVYKPTGAVYVIRTAALRQERTFHPANTLPHIMEASVNIDAEMDFILLEALLEKGRVHVHGL
jgi:CMP-N,N'-diacetyllegionaminic acid synthase